MDTRHCSTDSAQVIDIFSGSPDTVFGLMTLQYLPPLQQIITTKRTPTRRLQWLDETGGCLTQDTLICELDRRLATKYTRAIPMGGARAISTASTGLSDDDRAAFLRMRELFA